MDDAETFNSGLRIETTIFDCQQNFVLDASDPYSVSAWFETQAGNLQTSALLEGWAPGSQSPAIGAGVTPDDLFFDFIDYIGAFADSSDSWAQKWTSSVLE
jgi:hypothetical protein